MLSAAKHPSAAHAAIAFCATRSSRFPSLDVQIGAARHTRKVYASQNFRISLISMLSMLITSRDDSDFRHPGRPAVLGFSIGTNYPAPADRTREERNHIPLPFVSYHDWGF
jgi:hypothetical protein